MLYEIASAIYKTYKDMIVPFWSDVMSKSFEKSKADFQSIPTSTIKNKTWETLAKEYFEWEKTVTAKLV